MEALIYLKKNSENLLNNFFRTVVVITPTTALRLKKRRNIPHFLFLICRYSEKNNDNHKKSKKWNRIKIKGFGGNTWFYGNFLTTPLFSLMFVDFCKTKSSPIIGELLYFILWTYYSLLNTYFQLHHKMPKISINPLKTPPILK